jgi:4-amino-4-deoxy-L-arabinose transferase-like glycosyltransferase
MRASRLGMVVALAAIVRIAALLLLPEAAASDAGTYRQAGIDLFERGLIGSENVMPLYPAWTYITGGGTGLKLADIALSVATVWILHRLALEMFADEAVALTAAAIFAVYPLSVFYALQGISETAFTFLVCASFLALYRARFGWGSVLLVLAILVRPALDLLAPLLVVVFSAVVLRSGGTTTVKRLAGYAGIYVALMFPWWVHNYARYGELVRLNLGDGAVISEGNLCPPDDLGLFEEIREVRDCSDDAAAPAPDAVAENRAAKRETVRFMLDHPSYAAKVLVAKALAFWRPWAYSPDWRYKAVYLLSYGVVLVFALVFMCLYWRLYRRQTAPVMLLIAYWFVVHVITISYVRYRFPIEPFLVLFASCAAKRASGR